MTPIIETIGVIGAGHWGGVVARKIRDLPEIRVRHVFDVNTESARDLAVQVGANHAKSVADVCRGVDAVVIATPPAERLPIVEIVAPLVKHVRVEKPMAMNYGTAAQMMAACRMHRTTLSVGHTTCWSAFAAVARQCADLDAGPIVFTRRGNRRPAHANSTSVVWDLMSHDFALHHVMCPEAWAGGVPSLDSMTVDHADGTVGVVLEDGAVFSACWNAQTPARGVVGASFAYDELGKRLDIGLESVDVSWDDPLQRELLAWVVGDGFPASMGLDVVAMCEQVSWHIAQAPGVSDV